MTSPTRTRYWPTIHAKGGGTSITVDVNTGGAPTVGRGLLAYAYTNTEGTGLPGSHPYGGMAGWTPIVEYDAVNFSSVQFKHGLWFKVAAASEPNPTLTLANDRSTLISVTEIDSDQTPVVSNPGENFSTMTSHDCLDPGTPTLDALVLRYCGLDREPRTFIPPDPAGHTKFADFNSGLGNFSGAVLGGWDAPVAAGVAAGQVAVVSNGPSESLTLSILIEEAPAAGPSIDDVTGSAPGGLNIVADKAVDNQINGANLQTMNAAFLVDEKGREIQANNLRAQ